MLKNTEDYLREEIAKWANKWREEHDERVRLEERLKRAESMVQYWREQYDKVNNENGDE